MLGRIVGNKKSLTFVLIGSIVLAGSAQTQAGEAVQSKATTTRVQVNQNVVIFEGRMSLGYLNGEATELVYDPISGHKNSELQWDTNEVLMLGIGGSIQPKSWLRFNGDLRFNVTGGDNSLNDYDWLVPGWDYTHWSGHDDTDLNTGYTLDLNVEFPFYAVNANTKFSGFVGYKRDNWEWEAKGGSYVYSVNGFRDTIGTFPAGDKIITYEQWFDTPYIGLGFSTRTSKMEFYGRVIGSMLVQAGDKDRHHLRNLLFEEDFENGDMLGIDLGLAYCFTSHWAMTAEFHYQNYFENKGTSEITDLTTGRHIYIDGDAAGIDHVQTTWSLGVRYLF